MDRKLIKNFVIKLKTEIKPFCLDKDMLYTVFNRYLLEKYIQGNSLLEIFDYIKIKMPELFEKKIDRVIKNIKIKKIDKKVFGCIEIFDLCFQYYNFDEEGYYKKTQFYTPKNIAKKICENVITKETKSLLEPCCGSGVFLREIYNYCKNLEIKPEIEAYEIDARAIQLAKISYTLNAFEKGKEKIFLEIKNEDFLLKTFENKKKYDCIISNPPFLGRKFMPKNYMKYLKTYFPEGSENIAYGFLLKSLSLLNKKTKAGFIIPNSYLYLNNTRNFKYFLETNYVMKNTEISGEFKDVYGSKLSIDIIYIKNEKPERMILEKEKIFVLGDIATVVTGIQTGNNKKYLKTYGEIPKKDRAKGIEQENKKWYPYIKGGGYKKWSGNDNCFIFYENNGEELRKDKGSIIRNEKYFEKAGITYSYYCENRFSARYKDKGILFDIGGACLFFADENDLFYSLALLNSSVASFILNRMNPTMSIQTSTIKNFPLIIKNKEKIVELSKKAVKISKTLDKFLISSKYFTQPELNNYKTKSFEKNFIKSEMKYLKLKNELKSLEQKINSEFENIYNLYNFTYYLPKEKSKKYIRKKLLETFLKWLKPKNYNDILNYIKINYPKTVNSDLLFISKIINGKTFNKVKETIEKEILK